MITHVTSIGFDTIPRPYGTRTGYPELFSGLQGIDPTLTFARAGESAMGDLIDIRRQILKQNGVRGGPPVAYTQCAGVRVPVPPSAARDRALEAGGCARRLPPRARVLCDRGSPDSRTTRGALERAGHARTAGSAAR